MPAARSARRVVVAEPLLPPEGIPGCALVVAAASSWERQSPDWRSAPRREHRRFGPLPADAKWGNFRKPDYPRATINLEGQLMNQQINKSL